MQIDNIGILCKSYYKIGDCRTNIANHDTRHQQCRHMVNPSGKNQNKSNGEQRSDESSNNQCVRRYRLKTFQKINHSQRYHHLGTGGNTQNKRTGNGIFKKCLQEKTGQRKSSAQYRCHKNPWKPNFPYNIIGIRISLTGKYNFQNIRHRNFHITRINIQHSHYQKSCNQNRKHQSIPGTPYKVFSVKV